MIGVDLDETVGGLEIFDDASRLSPAKGRRAQDLTNVAMSEPLEKAPPACVVGRGEHVLERGQRELAPYDVADVLSPVVGLQTVAIVASKRDEERSHEPLANGTLHILPRLQQYASA